MRCCGPDHFPDAFDQENIVCGNDVVTTFERLQLMQFCLEQFSLRKNIFNISPAFSV